MLTPQSEIIKQYRPLAELVPAHWHAADLSASDGTCLHYTRTGGDKPTLLLLHGVQVNGLTWLRTAQALEADYDVIMPDFRGHGASGGVEHGASAQILVNDTLAIMRALGLEKPLVVGHSLGADIAGRVAAVTPLRGVVLVDPALQAFMSGMPFDVDNPPLWMQGLFDALKALKTMTHAERMEAGLGMMSMGMKIENEADYVSFIEGQAQFDLEFYCYMAQLGYLCTEPETIAQIACPILLLTARPMMPGANLEAGLAAFKNHWREGQHLHFEDSGHAIMFDQFARFVETVRGFGSRV